MSNAREIAMKVIYDVEFNGAYSNMALKKALKTDMPKQDKAFISNLVYGVTDRKLTLDYVIGKFSKIKLKKISKYILIILRMGIYQIMFMDKVPISAAVNESVKLARRYGHGASAGFVSYWNQKIFITDGFGYEEKSELITTKYLYYVLKNMESELNAMKRGAGVPHVSGEALNNIELPIPSLREQKRITDILEHFDRLCNDLSAGLPAEIEARQKQYEYYRDKLLSFKELQK